MAQPIAATFLLSLGFGGATSFIVNYAETRAVYPVSSFFLGSLVSGLMLRLYAGRYLDDFSRERVSAISAVLNLLGLVCVLWLNSPLQLWIGGALVGAAAAIYSGSLQAMAVERSADRVSAVTVFRGAVTLGVAFSSTLGGLVVDKAGFNTLFALLAAASCLALVLLMWPAESAVAAEA
jgi:MFS family permease